MTRDRAGLVRSKQVVLLLLLLLLLLCLPRSASLPWLLRALPLSPRLRERAKAGVRESTSFSSSLSRLRALATCTFASSSAAARRFDSSTSFLSSSSAVYRSFASSCIAFSASMLILRAPLLYAAALVSLAACTVRATRLLMKGLNARQCSKILLNAQDKLLHGTRRALNLPRRQQHLSQPDEPQHTWPSTPPRECSDSALCRLGTSAWPFRRRPQPARVTDMRIEARRKGCT